MNKWHRILVLNEDIDKIHDAIDDFENELEEARKECQIKGSLEQAASRLPGLFEYRFSQLQEVEAILEHLNIELRKMRSIHYKSYLEGYNRTLTYRDIEKYIDGEDDVVAWTKIINSFALIRNQYLGITKSMDQKNWQISNIVKLRSAGLEDVQI